MNAEELMLLNYGAGEYSWESLGLQGGPTDNPKRNQSWIFVGRTDAEDETPVHHLMWRINLLEKPQCWERLRGGEGDSIG